MTELSVQDRYAPKNHCFGCGPANDKGLQIKSREEGERLVAEWQPEAHHEAFDGILSGGIIGTLLDCHSNWTAAMHLMRRRRADTPPPCVTAEYAVQMERPTPSDRPVHLSARVVDSTDHKATVEAELFSGEQRCARCRGVFVAVKPGHPAFGRW